mmetsp:Transcript_5194/g.11949  ORF Transcript_5194/g.11949 Transcript_5194/m.11949 type:complete len:214 (+) Transcript_5194:394-1035(+)
MIAGEGSGSASGAGPAIGSSSEIAAVSGSVAGSALNPWLSFTSEASEADDAEDAALELAASAASAASAWASKAAARWALSAASCASECRRLASSESFRRSDRSTSWIFIPSVPQSSATVARRCCTDFRRCTSRLCLLPLSIPSLGAMRSRMRSMHRPTSPGMDDALLEPSLSASSFGQSFSFFSKKRLQGKTTRWVSLINSNGTARSSTVLVH